MHPVMALIRWAGIGSLAGLLVGMVVAGVFGRFAMHLVALSSPELHGDFTENQAPIGEFTFSGSVGLGLFAGFLFGIPGGVLYVVFRPWFAALKASRGFVFGLALMAVFGFTVIDPANRDFIRIGDPAFNVAAFLPLFVVFGLLIEPVVRWFDGVVTMRPRFRPIDAVVYLLLAGFAAIAFLTVTLMVIPLASVLVDPLESSTVSDRLHGAANAAALYFLVAAPLLYMHAHRQDPAGSRSLWRYAVFLLPAVPGVWLTIESVRLIIVGAT